MSWPLAAVLIVIILGFVVLLLSAQKLNIEQERTKQAQLRPLSVFERERSSSPMADAALRDSLRKLDQLVGSAIPTGRRPPPADEPLTGGPDDVPAGTGF